ncbi:hypothetical protein HHK36_032553 [Tetracentron sinense]|uniref:mitogen-activated protein kinase kinase kinase n=1 Tax=Tetracentron sinense TaxID=13715 RepID=A0A834Y7Q2_TETSI|nr:hypothetical protein HHK36_032553 [Tetracentron sinense]
MSSSVPRSPGRAETPTSPGSRWKKGKLLGRGTFGHVYVGFNSGSGEMCAMKEVTLFSDDAKSKESAKQLAQEITLLSRLRHQNIVQFYDLGRAAFENFLACKVDDKMYIYLEYVSGGSIYKLLQDYGQFGELAIRSYTQQILDIKGANILVDPNGRVKLADFGMAKNITGQSYPLSFKGSPYWMAPEVAAMFKIENSKELPAIPDHLSDDGKDFLTATIGELPVAPSPPPILSSETTWLVRSKLLANPPEERLQGSSSGEPISPTNSAISSVESLLPLCSDLFGLSSGHLPRRLTSLSTNQPPSLDPKEILVHTSIQFTSDLHLWLDLIHFAILSPLSAPVIASGEHHCRRQRASGS